MVAFTSEVFVTYTTYSLLDRGKGLREEKEL